MIITSDMENDALSQAAAKLDGAPENAAQIWAEIRRDLLNGGVMSSLIRKFRDEATEALRDLTLVNPDNAGEIRTLQTTVQRLIFLIQTLHEYRDRASADAVNDDNELSDDDYDYNRSILED